VHSCGKDVVRVRRKIGLNEDYLIPTMDQTWVYPEVAASVGVKAIEQGVAKLTASREDLVKMAEERIRLAQEMTKLLMKEGLIKSL